MIFIRRRHQQGFTILELLISFSIAFIMIGALIAFYAANKTNYKSQQGLQQLQENARFAAYQLNNTIRMAGYAGCGNTNTVTPTILTVNAPFDSNTVIVGHQGSGGGWNPALPSNLTGLVVANTDVIEVRLANPAASYLANNMATPLAAISVIPNTQALISSNQVLFITDCEAADIFSATSVTSGIPTTINHASPPNSSDSLSKAYQTDAQVAQYQYFAYYISNTGRTNSLGQPIYSLMQQDAYGNNTEIVEGVQDMQITYGIDTDADYSVDTYQTADVVQSSGNWGNVGTVNISLLLYTTESASLTPQPYTFNGTTVSNPGDNRLRQSWNVFVKLRNRGN